MTRAALTRPCAVAGSFYPAEPDRLAADVDRMLAAVPEPAPPGPVAIIVPHAGYRYSGPVAASAYRQLVLRRASVRRVLVMGPDHFTGLRAVALPSWTAFATPLGEVSVDSETYALAAGLPGVVVSAAAHLREHALEVQLPFLLRTLGPEVSVVPILVGEVRVRRVADLIDVLWPDDSTAVVLSTDLSHYHDQPTARLLDQRTADGIVRTDPEAIGDRAACGRFPLRGLLELARRRGLSVRLLDLRTSADTAGEPSRVVGYGAFALYR
jgi:AmmeMemoRadiSam system protein B